MEIKDLAKLNSEELTASATAYHEEFTAIILGNVLPELKNLLVLLDSVIPCKQYQLAVMDVEAIRENLLELVQNGPAPRLREIAIEDSEVQEEDGFEEQEFDYADEDQSEYICNECSKPQLICECVSPEQPNQGENHDRSI